MIDKNTPLVKTKFHEQSTSYSMSRVDRFLVAVKEEPPFVCVVSNRCLCSRAVVEFKLDKYDFDLTNAAYKNNVNFKDYKCKTCHNCLKMSHIPAQVVCNKLGIFCPLPELKNLNRLERILILHRILFKKVAIMLKGLFPKLKGAVCNIPVETEDLTNTIPQGADSNGLILVKLKSKLIFRGHEYFKAVSPDSVYVEKKKIKVILKLI